MSVVEFYGSSDDLIEVEGDVPGCDEYNGDDEHFIVIGGDGRQTRVKVWYARRGVWCVGVAPVNEDIAMLPAEVREANDYSALARLEDVKNVIHEVKA